MRLACCNEAFFSHNFSVDGDLQEEEAMLFWICFLTDLLFFLLGC